MQHTKLTTLKGTSTEVLRGKDKKRERVYNKMMYTNMTYIKCIKCIINLYKVTV